MTNATITFKTKVLECSYMGEDNVDHLYINVPKLKRSHCNMAEFRSHKKYGGFANSDLFENMLARIRSSICNINGSLRLDSLPGNVVVDQSKFLVKVTVTV
ncbi:MAG: hypothetical protein ACJAS1_003668 [Oleiphilaceae bacterium]|jgi:hypothetical protein